MTYHRISYKFRVSNYDIKVVKLINLTLSHQIIHHYLLQNTRDKTLESIPLALQR